MPDKTVPPGSAPAEAEACETEHRLFARLPVINSTPQSIAHEKALEIESQALDDRLRASGLTVTVKAPPKGTAPFVATFHRAKQKLTKGEN